MTTHTNDKCWVTLLRVRLIPRLDLVKSGHETQPGWHCRTPYLTGREEESIATLVPELNSEGCSFVALICPCGIMAEEPSEEKHKIACME